MQFYKSVCDSHGFKGTASALDEITDENNIGVSAMFCFYSPFIFQVYNMLLFFLITKQS